MLPKASSADSFWTIIVHERVLWRDNKNQMIEDTAPHATDVLLEPIVVMRRHRLGSRDFNSQFDETDHRPHQSLLLSLKNTIQHKKHANRCVRQVRHHEIARGALDYQMARNRWLPLMQKIDIVSLESLQGCKSEASIVPKIYHNALRHRRVHFHHRPFLTTPNSRSIAMFI